MRDVCSLPPLSTDLHFFILYKPARTFLHSPVFIPGANSHCLSPIVTNTSYEDIVEPLAKSGPSFSIRSHCICLQWLFSFRALRIHGNDASPIPASPHSYPTFTFARCTAPPISPLPILITDFYRVIYLFSRRGPILMDIIATSKRLFYRFITS
jgi:hypothetical protein